MTAGGAGEAVALVGTLVDEVWNAKNVGRLRELLAENAVIHPASGEPRWLRDDLAAHALAMLAAFPDLCGELHDVLAVADGGETRVAARWSWHGTNRGYSFAGAPAGREVATDELLVATVRLGRVVELWQYADEAELARQLWHDPLALARARRATRPDGWPARDIGGLPFERPALPGTPPGTTPEAIARGLIDTVWNGQLLGALPTLYAPEARRHAPDGEASGPDEIAERLLALLAAFPDATFQLDDLLADAERAMLRWTLRATHRGPGPWGTPAGLPVQLGGATLLHVTAARIHEEWTAWNELALLEQLLPEGTERGTDAPPLLSS